MLKGCNPDLVAIYGVCSRMGYSNVALLISCNDNLVAIGSKLGQQADWMNKGRRRMDEKKNRTRELTISHARRSREVG